MKKKKPSEFDYKLYRPIASDKRLTPNEKLVAAYIYTFESFKKPCTASNTHMAKQLPISESSVSTAITSLVEHGYIRKDKNYLEGKGYTVLRPEIIKEPYYKVYSSFFGLELTPSARLILVYTSSYLFSGKRFYASNSNISKALGMAVPTITDGIKQLKAAGLFDIMNPNSRMRELKFVNGK